MDWFKKLSYFKRPGYLSLIISILVLILNWPSIYDQWTPDRAKLTLFISHIEFKYVHGPDDNYSFYVTVFVKIINDGQITATIRDWELNLNFNIPYKIVERRDSHGGLLLFPSTQTDITFVRSIVGENNASLSSNNLESLTVTIWYEDYLGVQTVERQYILM